MYANIDEEVYRVYRTNLTDEEEAEEAAPKLEGVEVASKATQVNYASWLATENVIMAFFAAVAQFSSSETKSIRVDDAIESLLKSLKVAVEGDDVLGLETFEKIRGGNNPRRVNVGLATRRLLTNGFKEFFRESGEIQLLECWKLAAE